MSLFQKVSTLKGWMDDLRVYVLFNVQYFSHIRTMRVDNERLYAVVIGINTTTNALLYKHAFMSYQDDES